METRFEGWPVVTLTASGEPASEVREAIIAMLRTALERGQPFAAVVDVTAPAATGSRPDGHPRSDPHVSDQARAVKDMRTALASRCQGLAFVVPAIATAGPGSRFWGCPVTSVRHFPAALSWARTRLTG